MTRVNKLTLEAGIPWRTAGAFGTFGGPLRVFPSHKVKSPRRVRWAGS